MTLNRESKNKVFTVTCEMFYDKKFAASLESAGQPAESAGGDGGDGGLGDLAGDTGDAGLGGETD